MNAQKSKWLAAIFNFASVFVFTWGTGSLVAQDQKQAAGPKLEAGEAVVVDRGDHHRTWARTIRETAADGTISERTSSYVELNTGMHVLRNGNYEPAEALFEFTPEAVIANRSQLEVRLPLNINTAGGVQMSKDARRFTSHVLGIAFTDAASGRSVLIAELQDTAPEQIAPGEILYRNAFKGPFQVDLRYKLALASIEQDLILRDNNLPSPAEYNLPPETTRLEIFTEFLEAPEPVKQVSVLATESDAQKRAQMVDPDLTDEQLTWGELVMGPGTAFPLDGTDTESANSVQVGKTWVTIEGRRFNIERLDYPQVKRLLDTLPNGAAVPKAPRAGLNAAVVKKHRSDLLASLKAPASKGAAAVTNPQNNRKAPIELQIQHSPPEKGLVIDYAVLLSQTNWVFRSDSTYFLSNSATVYLSGTTRLDSAVIKIATNATKLQLLGPLECRTDRYRPAYVVAKDDDTVGEPISGSTGDPSAYLWYGKSVFELNATGETFDIHDLHVRNCARPLYSASCWAVVSHSQFTSCSNVVASSIGGQYGPKLRNVLACDVQKFLQTITGAATTSTVEHVTLHRVDILRSTNATISLLITNSLLVSCTNNVIYAGANNVEYSSDSGIFQTVGAGSHYLISGSTNRGAGTTNINPGLLSDLRSRTSHPPIVLSNAIITDTVLLPQAPRNTGPPDLGALYAPLDYVVNQVSISNATLTIQPGTAVGVYGPSTTSGLVLLDGANVICEGTPATATLNRFVRYNNAQEQAVTNWSASSVGKTISTPTSPATNSLSSTVRFRFTEWVMPPNGNDHFYGGTLGLTATIQDCEFTAGSLTVGRPAINLLNNLFERTQVTLAGNTYAFQATARNGTHFGGSLTLQNNASGAWAVKDNLFDQTTTAQSGTVTNNYNGYTTNVTRLTPNGANDVLLAVTNVSYDTWPPATGRRFYLPSGSPFINAGSQYATNAGLYHYTVLTNQLKEAGTLVDLGFHRVALTNGLVAVDTDLDSLPDYLEDVNGNGAPDTGESDWQTYNSSYGLSGSPGLQVFTPLK